MENNTVEFSKKLMFPKKRLDMEYMYSYLLKSVEKYPNRSADGVSGVYRSLQDGIGFAKEGGRIPLSEGAASLFQKQGYLLRKQITVEHRTPLATYKHEIHKSFYKDPDLFWKLLWEKTDLVLVTKEEDARLRKAGLTSSLPKDGKDRYEVAGIRLSDIKISLQDIKYPISK